MRDLEIYRRLVANEATVEDLRALEAWPLSRRVGYLRHVVPLASHDDAAIRAAALALLGGSRGIEGLRILVARLDDVDETVRAAALEALRAVARDAPDRYVHALYHPRAAIRRAALSGELSIAVSKLAVYLRADGECADLARALRWPEDSLDIATELFAAGHVTAPELVEQILRTGSADLATLLDAEQRRTPEQVDAYLDQAARAGAGPAPGVDVLDTLVAAIAAAPNDRVLDHLVATVAPKKNRLHARRAAVSLLHRGAMKNPALVGALVALEPRAIAYPGFDPALSTPAGHGLFRFHWPVKPSDTQLEKLLELPVVKKDLALAAAVVGLCASKRLETLATVFGEDAIVTALLDRDHGWGEICRLPQEIPSLEIGWLQRVEKTDYKRYIRLAGRALGIFGGKRLENFVEQMPRRHRQGAFFAALSVYEKATDERLGNVCKGIAARVDKPTLLHLLQQLLGKTGDASGRVTLALVRQSPARLLSLAAAELDDAAVLRLVVLLLEDPAPREQELALAAAWTGTRQPAVIAWRKQIEVVTQPSFLTAAPITSRRALTQAERDRISRATPRDLATALAPALVGPVTGLCEALDRRDASVSIDACVALLGCADPLADVARVLDRFAEATKKFDAALDDAACAWRLRTDLPPLARARLWRWEQHGFAFLDWLNEVGVDKALELADILKGRVARNTLWKGISEAFVLLRYRNVPRFKEVATIEVARYAAERVDKDIGAHAARMAVAMVEAKVVPVEAVRERMLDRVADADGEAREYIARIVRLVGVPEPPAAIEPPPMPLVEGIRRCKDVDQLLEWCTDPRPAIVQEAALVLLVRGAEGQQRLAALLRDQLERLAAPTPILATIKLWDDADALQIVRELAHVAGLPPAWRFHIHVNLLARGEQDSLQHALQAVRDEPGRWYFRGEDWDALAAVADRMEVAIALADAPHHHAYNRAASLLMAPNEPDERVHAAMIRFLEIDGDRPLLKRVAVARRLAEVYGDAVGLPLLAEYVADERADDWMYTLVHVPVTAAAEFVELLLGAAMIAGTAACSEKRVWGVVQQMRAKSALSQPALAAADLYILEHAQSAGIRRLAAKYVTAIDVAHARLTRVAEVFAWGVRRGVELAGRLFTFHLTAKEQEFGHTRLDGSRIFISALPMLRGESYGRDIVEGLVLHEIGHHVYHRTPEALKLWRQAHAEGIGHFLNLIADEHLERNLRAVDPAYGDRLKRLGAYAFQHAPQEIKLAKLFGSLRGHSAPALIAAELAVAFDESSVRMRRGAILGELDRNGHPVARFARSLRMGLGNRAGDPLNAAALALCGKELRQLDMQGLYDLTKQLVSLFGGAIRVAQVFGGPEGLEFGERDDDVYGGMDDQILQREVERILDPRRTKGKAKEGPVKRLQINVSPDASFDKITHIVRVKGNQELHRAYASKVNRHSTRLRAFLDELGLHWLPMRARTQGRALDKTRLRALVTRLDPRILIARTPLRKTDLFLGVLIDCSGSMAAGDNISRAKNFAILVAESVRQLNGVEARFFGFTDSTIYDAGSAGDCNVVALASEGGNNDAAALYHAATVALNSNKRAKVLVMISDGLPTECSVAALRSLVVHLSKRRNIVCAQVAVRKLDEVCFPNYVVLDDSELDIAVAKFGRMIGDLARRSLAT